MEFQFVLLIKDLFVIIFLSSRERSLPIQIRRWCRIRIGAFPSGLNPDGFSCFWFDPFGPHHHRDHDHASPFSKLREDLQTRNWDPGGSNCKPESGGLRQSTSHTYGRLFEIVSEICILALHRPTTFGIFFHSMFFPVGIRGLLLNFKIRDINLGFEEVMAIPLSDQLDAQSRSFVLSYSPLFVAVTNTKSFLEASDLRISGRPKLEKEIVFFSGSMEKRIMDINEQQWVGCYRRHHFKQHIREFVQLKLCGKHLGVSSIR